ncbi:hypothetical protein BW731_06350 [Vagococcus martis]|uniref:Uncharacterized protein n=1 Tax=Vagococcus martis TaxID=1768210 RepID=A0A1V4DHL8_9ENTE|nr:hypothetical protein [Vagococcus martis]OPF87826.1 hypothetical protein BW731_06350 [Vagococcus martis]
MEKKLFILLLFFLFNFETDVLANQLSYPEGGDVYSDVGDNLGELGIASRFHIFAENSVEVNAHVNGNIASNHFFANSNFGTDIREGILKQEIVYLNKIHSIVSSSFVEETNQRSTKFVVGKDNVIDIIDNGRAVSINGIKLDHVSKTSIYQDRDNNYINFKHEFNELEKKQLIFLC